MGESGIDLTKLRARGKIAAVSSALSEEAAGKKSAWYASNASDSANPRR